jgi:hypothetical protein
MLAVIAAIAALAGWSADPPSQPQPTTPTVVTAESLPVVAQALSWHPFTNDVVPPIDSDDPDLSPSEDADVADADLIIDLGGFQPAVFEGSALVAAGEALDVHEFVPRPAAPHFGGRSPPPNG